MDINLRRLVFVVGVAINLHSSAMAENWPAWRGLRGDGTTLESGLPTKWSGTENVVWKTPIPGVGYSSPIVWGDHIFLTTAFAETKNRTLLCVDRKSGKIVWQKTVLNAPLESKNTENSYASSTPATDGKHVYVTFLDGNQVAVAAYSFTGQQKWIVRPGPFDSPHGFCHSPVLFDDKVLLSCCGSKSGFIAALNCSDGNTVWKVEPKHFVQSFSNPFVAKMSGRMQLIVAANAAITGYDPTSGADLWTVDGPSQESIATPVYGAESGLLLVDSSWPTRFLVAIKPDGSGQSTANKVIWKTKEGASYVSSPIAVGDYFMSLSFGKSKCFYCYDASTGKILWKEGTAGRHHASPVVAGGLVYFLNDEGQMNIVRAGPTFDLVATNELGEETYASPAISQGQIFLRGFNNLYCIGKGR